MEWFLIELYKKEIKKHNEDPATSKDKKIKNEISTYTKPWQIVMWILLIVCLLSMICMIIYMVKSVLKVEIAKGEAYFYSVAIVAAVLSMTTFLILQSCLSRRFAKENIEMHKERLKILKLVVEEVYGKTALEKKVDSLVEIYGNKLEKIEKEASKKAKVLWTAFSIIGAIAATSIANIEKIGIGFDEWLAMIVLIMMLALVTVGPIYLSSLITPNKDKYSLMRDRLVHLRVTLMTDDCLKVNEAQVTGAQEAVNNNDDKQSSAQKKKRKKHAN